MTTRGEFDGSGLDDESIEAILTGAAPSRGHADLVGVVSALRSAVDGPAPTPSAALADLLAHGRPAVDASTDEVARVRRRRTVAAAAATLAAAATFAVSGVAAAHDALPGPIEHVVTKIVNNATPFTINAPRHHRSRVTPTAPHATSTEPGEQQGSPGGRPSSGTDESPRDRSGRSGESGDDGGRAGRGSDDRSARTGDGGRRNGPGRSSDDSGSGSGSGDKTKSGSDQGSGSGSSGTSGETSGSGETGGSGETSASGKTGSSDDSVSGGRGSDSASDGKHG